PVRVWRPARLAPARPPVADRPSGLKAARTTALLCYNGQPTDRLGVHPDAQPLPCWCGTAREHGCQERMALPGFRASCGAQAGRQHASVLEKDAARTTAPQLILAWNLPWSTIPGH